MSEQHSNALDRAADLTRRGFAVIPVPHGAKGPRISGWQRLRLTAADLPQHFNGTPKKQQRLSPSTPASVAEALRTKPQKETS